MVASEVRALAQRAAGAAGEIRRLIEGSVSRIRAGADQAQTAGSAIGDLADGMRDVVRCMHGIASACQEQHASIAQISVAVRDMDRGTQQNAALVEEATAAARMLEEQAEGLLSAAARFRTAAPGAQDPAQLRTAA